MQEYNTEKYGMPSWTTLLKSVAKVDMLLFKKLAAKHRIQGALVTMLITNITLCDRI